MLRLKERGRYYELPIEGLCIAEIIFTGMLRIVFTDEERSYIDFHSRFKVMEHNQYHYIDSRSREGIVLFYDLFGKPIKEAIADKVGNMWITFQSGVEIMVEDGPYENWHYTKKSTNSKDILYVHGGVGQTYS